MRAFGSLALELSCHSHRIKVVPEGVTAEISQQQEELWCIATGCRWLWASIPQPEDELQMHTHPWDTGLGILRLTVLFSMLFPSSEKV